MVTMIVQDDREKKGYHNSIEDYCKKNNIPLYRKRLLVGDYMLCTISNGQVLPIGNTSIDCKGGGILELICDLYTDKKALNKKYRKCYEQGIHLIVLVEEEIKSLQELVSWRSKYTKLTGRELLDMIDTLKVSYGVDFHFCKKENTGEVLVQLLSRN